jgi:predicted MFS family arabinose efflux permease
MAASPYRVLLHAPAVRRQAATGLLAQTTQGAGGVGIILVIRGQAGSLALAGAVVGVLSVAAGVARPVQGRLIDTRGARGLMVICGIAHPAALAAIVVLADGHAPGAALLAMGVVAGVTLPPVSTCMRVVWGTAVGGADRTSAYSLVYLTQELSILAGPLLLAAIMSATEASAALVTVAAVACAGTLGFALWIPAGLAHGGVAPRGRGGAVLRAPGVPLLIATAVLVGGVIGGVQVAVPTFASAHHAPAASGVLIAVLSIGGIAGAAIYGSRQWQWPPSARLLVLLAALSVAVAITVVAPNLAVLGAALAVAGVALNPSLTTISLHVDWHVSPTSAAEAFGWLSTGIATGTGAANAVAGVASHPGDPRPAFIVATVAAVAATVLVGAARRTLARGYSR